MSKKPNQNVKPSSVNQGSSENQTQPESIQPTSVQPNQAPDQAPTAEATEAQAQPTQAPDQAPTAEAKDSAPPKPPTAEERLLAERTQAEASVKACSTSIAEALASGDADSIATIAATMKRAQARIAEIDGALVSARFAPQCGSLIRDAISNGTLVVPVTPRMIMQAIFENGVFMGCVPVTIGTLSERRENAAQGAVKAPPVVRSNLRASVDSRLPGEGWRRTVRSHGIDWTVTMLGGVQCSASAPGQTDLTGTVGQVCNAICRSATNAYRTLGLGEPGEVWNDASPKAGWAKA